MQTAVIIGVGPSAGLGAALCHRYAKGGFHVFAAGRTMENLEAVTAAVNQAGGTATAFKCDATQENDVIALFEAADGTGDGLGAAVYNAGNNARGDILGMEASFFESVWRVTCLGGFLAGREAARRLVARQRGSIIFTGATASLRGKPPFTAFASGKAALRSFAQSLAKDIGPKGVHVGHVIIDGGIHGEKILANVPQILEARGEDGLLDIAAIAESFWHLHGQDRTAWTFELDLRPYKESF